MTKAGRVRNVILGLIITFTGVLIADSPNSAYRFAVFLLSCTLFIYSIRQFVFYAAMARHMVGGRAMLYRAIITFDLALFTMSLTDISPIYVMLYLIIVHAFQGGIDIMGALTSRKEGAHWKLDLIRGMIDIVIAVLCIIFIRSVALATFIYGIGLIYSGIIRIISAFQRSAIVYIQ